MSYKGHFFKHHLKARPPPPGAGPRTRALFAYRLTGPWVQQGYKVVFER